MKKKVNKFVFLVMWIKMKGKSRHIEKKFSNDIIACFKTQNREENINGMA